MHSSTANLTQNVIFLTTNNRNLNQLSHRTTVRNGAVPVFNQYHLKQTPHQVKKCASDMIEVDHLPSKEGSWSKGEKVHLISLSLHKVHWSNLLPSCFSSDWSNKSFVKWVSFSSLHLQRWEQLSLLLTLSHQYSPSRHLSFVPPLHLVNRHPWALLGLSVRLTTVMAFMAGSWACNKGGGNWNSPTTTEWRGDSDPSGCLVFDYVQGWCE